MPQGCVSGFWSRHLRRSTTDVSRAEEEAPQPKEDVALIAAAEAGDVDGIRAALASRCPSGLPPKLGEQALRAARAGGHIVAELFLASQLLEEPRGTEGEDTEMMPFRMSLELPPLREVIVEETEGEAPRCTAGPPNYRILVIGDLHGQTEQAQMLWVKLEQFVGTAQFETAVVIFLGDYVDRGPDSYGVLQWLLELPERHPHQSHYFLCGNHDFGFASYLGLFGNKYAHTQQGFHSRKGEPIYNGPGAESMHLQGIRWGGKLYNGHDGKGIWSSNGKVYQNNDSLFATKRTFRSYGVPSYSEPSVLSAAVPDQHKAFMRRLRLGLDLRTRCGWRLLLVHAGLLDTVPVEEQLEALRGPDPPALHDAFVEQLQAKKTVVRMPRELESMQARPGAEFLLISGHHHTLHIGEKRWIIDENGGDYGYPMSAMVLPDRVLVRDIEPPTA